MFLHFSSQKEEYVESGASLVCRSASELIIVDLKWHNIELLLMIVYRVFQLCRSLHENGLGRPATSALTVAQTTLL